MIFINISCENAIEEYSDLVYRIALSQVKSKQDAEDIFQEVFIALIKNMDSIKDKTHMKYWLIRTTINHVKNHNICFWKRKVSLQAEDLSCDISHLQDDIIQIEKIRNEINMLPSKLRSAVYLYYYEEYSVDEIATILKIPSGTVKSRLYKARKVLKIKLKEICNNENRD